MDARPRSSPATSLVAPVHAARPSSHRGVGRDWTSGQQPSYSRRKRDSMHLRPGAPPSSPVSFELSCVEGVLVGGCRIIAHNSVLTAGFLGPGPPHVWGDRCLESAQPASAAIWPETPEEMATLWGLASLRIGMVTVRTPLSKFASTAPASTCSPRRTSRRWLPDGLSLSSQVTRSSSSAGLSRSG